VAFTRASASETTVLRSTMSFSRFTSFMEVSAGLSESSEGPSIYRKCEPRCNSPQAHSRPGSALQEIVW
jgi:hypothetical protein